MWKGIVHSMHLWEHLPVDDKTNSNQRTQVSNIEDLPESFCLAPFVHRYKATNGRRRVCCQSREYLSDPKKRKETELLSAEDHWNSDLLKSFRKRMLNGEKLPECSSCHSAHKMTNSYKNFFNEQFSDVLEEVLKATTLEGNSEFTPISYDYRFSNLCNLSCRMCGPIFSSKWEREISENFESESEVPEGFEWGFSKLSQVNYSSDVEELRENALNGNVRDIYWVGGEPLLWPEHWSIMEELVTSGRSKEIDVRYNTNLTILKNKNLDLVEDLLPNFKSFTIGASQDGYGEVAEYIRTGLDFEEWETNLRKLCTLRTADSFDVYIDFTLTLPGIFSLKSLIELSNELQVPMMAKPVFTESANELLSLKALPRELLNELVSETVENLRGIAVESRNLSLVDLLESFKDEPNYEEMYPESYLEQSKIGKAWLKKLENLRSSKTSMDAILSKNKKVFQWWKSIN